MSDVVKTVKVQPWGKGQGNFVEVNADDFDPKAHKLAKGEAAPVASRSDDEAVLADPHGLPAANDEALVEAAKPVAAPVRKPSRKKGK